MKTALILLVCVVTFAAGARATEIGAEPAPGVAAGERLAPEQLEQLVAPIALYPDPLLAVILPAATQPSDIVLAMRYLESGGDPNAVDQQPWDDSVKALVRYREVLEYLDDNLEWTRSLGETFLDQREDVMASIQTLRTRAHESGMLASTTQQEVIVEPEDIRIVPAQPTVIYVPRYDPEVLYVNYVSAYPYSYWNRPFISFGIGYSIGSWLSYDCDWRYRNVYVVHRPAHWYYRPDWRVRYVHRDRYPDYRWTRWAPRHDRSHYRRDYRSSSQIVLSPQRRFDQPRATRGSNHEGWRHDGARRSFDGRRYEGQRYEGQRSFDGRRDDNQRVYSAPNSGGGERNWSRRGDRGQVTTPVAPAVTAPQAVVASPSVSALQVTRPAPRADFPRRVEPTETRTHPRRDGRDGQPREWAQRPSNGGVHRPTVAPPTRVAEVTPSPAPRPAAPAARPAAPAARPTAPAVTPPRQRGGEHARPEQRPSRGDNNGRDAQPWHGRENRANAH